MMMESGNSNIFESCEALFLYKKFPTTVENYLYEQSSIIA